MVREASLLRLNEGDMTGWYGAYYSQYPNNLLLVWVYFVIEQFARILGMEHLEFSLVVFQCILDTLIVFLIYRVTFHLTGSYRMSWCAYLLGFLFTGLSPWYIIPYSDGTGSLFPILTVRIYQLAKTDNRKIQRAILLILMGCVGAFGYRIKPQTVIVLIAIVGYELLCHMGKGLLENWKELLRKGTCACVGAVCTLCLCSYVLIPSLHIELDGSREFGWQHFLMMGLNTRTDGAWAEEDVQFSGEIAEKEERDEENLRIVKERLSSLGVKGVALHLCRKQLVNYGDGTFAWNVEGNFFQEQPEWAQNASSTLIRSLIYPDGSGYQLFCSSKQQLWVMILTLQPFAVYTVLGRKKTSKEVGGAEAFVCVMMLSILGLTLFELLFESRARYLFTYAPLYVILATVGLGNLYRRLRDGWMGRHQS